MSVDYAAALSEYDDLGVCGVDEVVESKDEVNSKIEKLANLLEQYKGSCIVHVGAGISTSAGIPDFRGPLGVWTKAMAKKETKLDVTSLDKKIKLETDCDGLKKEINDIKQEPDRKEPTSFDNAQPTFTHMALKKLIDEGYINYIVSQNVDGLFLKSNFNRSNISELHGNFYLDECTKCKTRFIRSTSSPTLGLKKSQVVCPKECGGYLRDTILDWESPIPHNELRSARAKSKKNRLHICIGTTMQLMPANQLPLEAKRRGFDKKIGQLVVINLQPTKFEANSDLSIHHYADDVMRQLCDTLNIVVPPYDCNLDPTKNPQLAGKPWLKN